jgi:hypothetical protein
VLIIVACDRGKAADIIDWAELHKAKRAKALKDAIGAQSCYSRFPVRSGELEQKLIETKTRTKFRNAFNYGKGLARNLALAAATACDFKFSDEELAYDYVQVTSVTEEEAQEVYDLSVPETESFVANGIVNHNTCNVPKEYTVDQTRELYELMYKLGCKGGTIYRDGSRDEQVLNLTLDTKKKEEPKPAPVVKSRKKVRDRPKTATGMTTEKDSPIGKVFVTLNMDEHGEPLEIFINAGKAGSDMFSVSEALGRALSLSLRIESPMTPMERLNEIHDQFEGIGGSNSIGMGKNKIKSMPDAVAKAIEDILVQQASTRQPSTVEVPKEERANHDVTPPVLVKDERRVTMDICPKCGEAAFISEEGCQHCVSCGHSRCG